MAEPVNVTILEFREAAGEARVTRHGYRIVAHFNVKIGPVRLTECVLYKLGSFKCWWPDPRRVEVDPPHRKAIRDALRAIHDGELNAPITLTVDDMGAGRNDGYRERSGMRSFD